MKTLSRLCDMQHKVTSCILYERRSTRTPKVVLRKAYAARHHILSRRSILSVLLEKVSTPERLFRSDSPCSRPSIAPYCDRVRAMVTPKRFEHIARVAGLAETIARANNFTPSELRATCLAAVLHDAARDLEPEAMFKLAPPETDMEREQPLSVHGRASRRLAEQWGVTDERILEAIEGHVFGVAHDNRIGMAVYIADVSEPGRGVNGDIRELAMSNLFRAYQRALDSKVNYLRSKGKAVHPATLKVYKEICSAA
jgi:predicted HD superfamily hydrolase involved in NAD metabolism